MDRKPLTFRERFYRISRKIRFLLKRGSLFKVPPPRDAGHAVIYSVARGTYPIIFFNSTIIFLLAYVMLDSLTKLATGISAMAFDFNSIILYYGVDFLVLSRDWSTDSVQVIFSTGPVLALILGVLVLILYIKVMEESGILRLLLLWLFSHCMVILFGEILAGALLSKGFGYVIMYLFFMDTGKMILSLFSMVVLVTLGLFMARMYLYTGNIYFNFLSKANRGKFIRYQFLYPWIVGDIILILLKLPEVRMYEISVNLTMFFLLMPVILRGASMQDLYFDEEPRTIKVSLYLTGITVLFLAAFRIVLEFGIRL
jgi:hypothetical protein